MKNCLIVVNTYKEESHKLAKQITEFLQKKNINSSILEFNGFSDVYPFSGYDLVITLGGDGTVLYACRGCAELNIPVFPVNLGQFGFIAGIQPDEWQELLEKYIDQKMTSVKRSMLSFSVVRNGKEVASGSALNDIVVRSKATVSMVSVELANNGISLGDCKADGIIIATSTGSTAYSASAGGPIVDPEVEAMILTPINPFSLSMRPLVINARSELSVKILPSREKNVILSFDGQTPFELLENDIVKITKLEKDAIIIGPSKEKFYNSLRFKLNWSGGPHA